MNRLITQLFLIALLAGVMQAQAPRTHLQAPAQGRMSLRSTNNDRAPLLTPGMGKWWKDSGLMQKIGVNDGQVQQIEKIFQDRRPQLVDLHAALEKQETLLGPLVETDHPDQAQVSAQIDKIAQSRGALEKANAEMLLSIRRVLTSDQWKRLKRETVVTAPAVTPPPEPSAKPNPRDPSDPE